MNDDADTSWKKHVKDFRTSAENKHQYFGDSDTNDIYTLNMGCKHIPH